MPDHIRCEIDGALAHVVLDRPDVLNAMHAPMRDELIACMGELDEDERIRAITITGAGERAFCAGQDLEEAVGFEGEAVASWARHQGELLRAIRALNKPLVAGFDGVATGVGFQIGMLADLRIGYPELRLGQPEVRVGLASIYGSYLMSLHLGLSHNSELSLGGELIDGNRAYELGLINRLVPRRRVAETMVAAASRLADLPSAALCLTKQRFREQTQAGFDAACEAAVAAQVQSYASGEPQRLMRAFLEARRVR